jgi:hypothetical protein
MFGFQKLERSSGPAAQLWPIAGAAPGETKGLGRVWLTESPKVRATLDLGPSSSPMSSPWTEVTRLLRRLHAHDLVAQIPHSRRWRVSLDGRRTTATAIKLRKLAYPSLFAAAARIVATSSRITKILRTKNLDTSKRSSPSHPRTVHHNSVNLRRFLLTLRSFGEYTVRVLLVATAPRWHLLVPRGATTSGRAGEETSMAATSIGNLVGPTGRSRGIPQEKGWTGRRQPGWKFRHLLPLWVALASWLGGACQSDRNASTDGRVIRSALKAAGGLDLGAIFGMETPTAWSTVTPGAVLGRSSVHSQGSYSLSVRPSNSNGFTPIKSVALATLPVVSPTLAVDIMLPTYQPNPWWYGTAQAYIDCPSRGIWSQFLNQVELTGRPLGVWTTVNFTLTNAWITALLQAGYSDLTITVVLNVQVPTTGVYYVDNLRFVPLASNGCGGRPNGTSCTDNSACTLGDTCQSGTCHSGTAVTCTASDQCHNVGTCNPATGVCSNPVKPGTPSCNDGNACTQDDKCQAGVCVGGVAVICAALDQCHDVGTCDPVTGDCSTPPLSAGTVCRPAAGPCDVEEICDGTGSDCPADGFAQASQECRPAAGTCDVAEVCSGTSADCPPDIVLAVGTRCRPSVGSCDPAELCDGSSGVCPADERIPDGTGCDDQSACTANDQCQGGKCVGEPAITCPPSGEACAQTYCDPQTGACLTAAAEGSPCDDGDPQTSGEMCLGGRCMVPDSPLATFCAAHTVQMGLLQSGASAVADTQATERKIQAHIMHQPPTAESYAYLEPVVIPVVFHLLENPNIPHIDDWQFPELLDKANALYAKMWTGTIPDRSKEDASTVPIKLVMAQRSPTACTGAGSTNGIDRVQVTANDGHFSMSPFVSNLCRDALVWTQPENGGVSAWDPSKYLNVWIAWEANHTFDGVANPPYDEKTQTYNTGTSCDGVTLNLNGMSTGIGPPPERRPFVSIDEAILVHEIGHWLGLYHLQHPNETASTIPGVCKGATPDSCSTEGDYVCDTPASLGRTAAQACTTGQNSCTDSQCRAGSESCSDPPPDNPPDSLENYMWFTQCGGRTGFFTVHQTERMEATLADIRSGILSSQNDIPSASGSAGDLWSRDGADDDGSEPDNTQGVVWNSNDIWVRNQDDGNKVQQHEDPVYQTYESDGETKVKDVYVYVRVRNRGCEPASDTVRLRWAKASTNLGWPASWNGSVTVPGNGAPMGGEIGTGQSTGFIQPGESKILTFAWQPKDPSLYAGVDADKTHYCLLSTIGEVDDESRDMIELVRARNDIAWRNISVASDSNGGRAAFSIQGVPQGDSQDLEFTEPPVVDPQQSIFTWGSVLVDLKPGLFARWTAGGSFGTGIVPVSGTVVKLMGSGAAIQNIQLQPEDIFTLEVSLQPNAASTEPNRSRVDVYQLDVAQLSESNDTTQLVGGVRIAVKTRRPVPLSSPPPPIP